LYTDIRKKTLKEALCMTQDTLNQKRPEKHISMMYIYMKIVYRYMKKDLKRGPLQYPRPFE